MSSNVRVLGCVQNGTLPEIIRYGMAVEIDMAADVKNASNIRCYMILRAGRKTWQNQTFT